MTLLELHGMISSVSIDCPGHEPMFREISRLIEKYGALTTVDADAAIKYLYRKSSQNNRKGVVMSERKGRLKVGDVLGLRGSDNGCPFCGGEDLSYETTVCGGEDVVGDVRAYVTCTECYGEWEEAYTTKFLEAIVWELPRGYPEDGGTGECPNCGCAI